MRPDKIAGTIARERLKCVMESEPFDCSAENLTQMKKEILEIMGRYFDLSPENYDIKIVLKNKKRATND